MKNLNKRELKNTVHNHSSNTDFKDFMILHKNCSAKPHSFLIIDDTLALDNPACFRKNLLEKNLKTNH